MRSFDDHLKIKDTQIDDCNGQTTKLLDENYKN